MFNSDYRVEEFRSIAQDVRDAVERPLGKVTYNIRDQRAFDRALDALFREAVIDPLGA